MSFNIFASGGFRLQSWDSQWDSQLHCIYIHAMSMQCQCESQCNLNVDQTWKIGNIGQIWSLRPPPLHLLFSRHRYLISLFVIFLLVKIKLYSPLRFTGTLDVNFVLLVPSWILGQSFMDSSLSIWQNRKRFSNWDFQIFF